MDLSGKVALVTGAGGGIGRAAALGFAAAGAAVVCADLSDAAEAVADETGGSFVRTDVADGAQVEAMVAHAVRVLGRLDIAFNNAGIIGPMGRALTEIGDADWAKVIAVNLTSVFLCMKAQIPAMLAGGGGAIVNNASVAGLIGAPRNPAYGAAKAGVVSLTRSAALQYAGRGIRVNCVCPGVIETGFNPPVALSAELPDFPPPWIAAGRAGRPEEVAALAVWLASDAASYLHGEAIGADGGWRHI